MKNRCKNKKEVKDLHFCYRFKHSQNIRGKLLNFIVIQIPKTDSTYNDQILVNNSMSKSRSFVNIHNCNTCTLFLEEVIFCRCSYQYIYCICMHLYQC